MTPPVRLTESERRLLQDTTFFPAKAALAEKVKAWLMELRDLVKKETAGGRFLAPDGTDFQQGQLVKGEHLLDFPYHYLDCPKYFSPGEMFTYRTLVWWGHHVVFALILQGPQSDRYKANLMAAYDQLADRELALLMTDTPWEWRQGDDYLLPLHLNNRQAVEAALAQRPFIKLHRCLSFDHPAIIDGRLAEEGLATFRLLSPILLKDDAGF
ncbi:MAG: hypothetical protein HY208_02800 [Nitrospirae bacterium]|nr:hypothetical protein [Nitrospirota bacterium]